MLKLSSDEKMFPDESIIPQEISIILQEILRVAFGSKPGLLLPFSNKNAKAIQQIFPNLTVINGGLALNPVSKQNPLPNYVIAKNIKIAKELIEAQAQQDSEKNGQLLGYPKCCVRQFLRRNCRPWAKDLIYQTFSRSYGKCSCYNNNLFNFSSRLGNNKGHFKQLRKFDSINKSFPFSIFQLHLISHVPCSYNCRQSISIGKESYSLLREHYPRFASVIKPTLRRPVLFFDIFEWVVFDGFVGKNQVLYYKGIAPPVSLISNDLSRKFLSGNKAKVSEDCIEIFKDNYLIYRYLKKDQTDGFIINFL